MFLTNSQLQTEVVKLKYEIMFLNNKLNTKNKHVKDIYYLQQAVKKLKQENKQLRKELVDRVKFNQTTAV